ncbi:MAG TPA: PspA/IM30 family protein [Ilumatobacteraceae bacterium]|nr:PspA/IM30 family protein [Ilumatobacteraceae bacterium]
MFRVVRKLWKYLAASLDLAHREHANPKVLLDQAIAAARDNHRQLSEKAAAVIAHQREAQRRRDRLIGEHARIRASLVSALELIDQHQRRGNTAEADRLTSTSEAVATRLLALEGEIERCERDLIDAALAADSARAAVADNQRRLRQTMADQSKMLRDIDRAEMTERFNAAIDQLSSPSAGSLTVEEVRQMIEIRCLRADATHELLALQAASSSDAAVQALEHELVRVEARRRLADMSRQRNPARPGGLPAIEERTHDESQR